MIDTGFSQPRAVVFEGARIFVEIFPGAELQAIDEDAGDDHVGVLAGLAHQVAREDEVVQFLVLRHEQLLPAPVPPVATVV